jgi:glucose/arabinose dehydrogenase
MNRRYPVHLVIAAVVSWSAPLAAEIRLATVVSGLSAPVFVAHAGDGSNRLFIVEQAGVIKVLRPGFSTPTTFLDVRSKVLSGGERGLLGLAFHPRYASNGRFFVYYTRIGDGALVVAEYNASANSDVASSTETILLTIPHPVNANHNGGMLAFSHDGLLHIGVGDGGSANDPPNNAQNPNVLLGKILRINVDQPDPAAGTRYLPAPDNPFVNATGRDEIFALGLRNPWRFSFDRLTGQQWVGDVGQGEREEVDTPILNGGNYGWRPFEGTRCTNVDPSLCTPSNYIPPLFEYSHVNGRCSVTGGYVYRGSLGVFASGTYVYGDFCSGEIFTWNDAQSLLFDTAMNISSFGEDEQGELYVVDLTGSVSRFVADCTLTVASASRSFAAEGGSDSVAVSTPRGCPWTAVSSAPWLRVTSEVNGVGDGMVAYSVEPNTVATARTGSLTIAGRTLTVRQSGVGASACTYSISPTSAVLPQPAGTGIVNVTAPEECAWTAVSESPWIVITTGASGTGNGSVIYAVSPYIGRAIGRNGTIKIATLTLAVRQSRSGR